MPTFEVTIESPDEHGPQLTLVVDAEDWVDAWREGLRIMGDEVPPEKAVCEVGRDRSVRIAVPDSPRTWVVRPRAEPSAAPVDPARAAGADAAPKTPPSEAKPRPQRARSTPRAPVKPLVRRPPGAALTTAPDAGRPDFDPRARRLDTGDRERLAEVARHVAIPSAVPDDEPAARGPRLGLDSTQIGRPATAGTATTGSERTSSFAAVVSDVTLLPKQFRAITVPPVGTRLPGGPAQEAVENAWHHIPCQIAQALRYGEAAELEVVAARGERERETLHCRVPACGAFERLLSPHPARVKFADDKARLAYVSGRADGVLEVPVRSALCVPIAVAGRPWGVLLLVNSTRSSGFADGELRAVTYLAATLGRALAIEMPAT